MSMNEENMEKNKEGNWFYRNVNPLILGGVVFSAITLGITKLANHSGNTVYEPNLRANAVLEERADEAKEDRNDSIKSFVSDSPKVQPQKPEEEKSRDYVGLLEKYTFLLESKESGQAERKDLQGKITDLEKQLNEKSKEQNDLQAKYTKSMEDYTSALKQKEAMGTKLGRLTSELGDLKKQQITDAKTKTDLEKKHTAVLEDYLSANKKTEALEKVNVELGVQYDALNQEGLKILEQKDALEAEKTELVAKHNQTLEAYTQLLTQRKKSVIEEPNFVVPEKDIGNDKLSKQVQMIKIINGLDIAFLDTSLEDIDNAKSGFFERTGNYSTKDIVSRLRKDKTKVYALLTDANRDGIKDLVYKRESIRLKLGNADGNFSPAKIISSLDYQNILKERIYETFGFE